jgi:hypothetical protein
MSKSKSMFDIKRFILKSVSTLVAAALFSSSTLSAASAPTAPAPAATAAPSPANAQPPPTSKPDPKSAAKSDPKTAPKKAAAPSGRALSRKPLNRNEILSLYLSGEFETLVSLLENIRRERQLRDREDSVFIYKFLGVIYGSNENTRRKAESFLYQMLKLDPQEDLSALGVGDSVESIFDRVRLRFSKAKDDSLAALGIKSMRPAASPPATVATPAPVIQTAPAPVAAAEPRKPVPGWVWLTGGGVAAAALVTTFVLVNQQPDPHVHTIPDTLR